MQYRYAKFIATRYLQSAGERNVRRTFFFVMDYESNMEVGLAAPNFLFIPARLSGLREGEARAGCRPSHAEAVAFASYKGVSRQLCSRLGVLAVLAEIAKVTRSLFAGFSVPHVALVWVINPSKSVSPNKAFKLARFTRWDWRAASPLISR